MKIAKIIFILAFALLSIQCGAKSIPTPLEEINDDQLTSYESMIQFLEKLALETSAFTIDTIGVSIENRSLVALHFNGPEDQSATPLKVFFYAQQHGNEASGKEAAIAFARDVATGEFSGFLKNIDFYLLPQVNPDGSEKQQRRNAAEADLNRDHNTLLQPEVLALHKYFTRIMPEVTLDIHEYGVSSSSWTEEGMEKAFGQQMGAASNPATSMAIRSYSWNSVLPGVAEQMKQRGVSFQRYLVTGAPDARLRYSTAAINDGRNSMSMYNTLSFLIEGPKGPTTDGDLRERTHRQLENIRSILTYFSENAQEARDLVITERAKLGTEQMKPNVALVMDYVKDPARPSVTVSVKNLSVGYLEEKVFENFYPLVQSSVEVTRPQGYVIPPERSDIIDLLKRFDIEVNPLEEEIRAAVEAYKITGVKLVAREDKESYNVSVDVTGKITSVPAGNFVVWCDQVTSNQIVILLEAQSQFGISHLEPFSSLLRVGSEYPITRIMKKID